jgi:hypothetical protein
MRSKLLLECPATVRIVLRTNKIIDYEAGRLRFWPKAAQLSDASGRRRDSIWRTTDVPT